MRKITLIIAGLLVLGLVLNTGCLEGAPENKTNMSEGEQETVDTTIEPGYEEIMGCTEITEPGKYQLTHNVSSVESCIEIKADNVEIDGSGYTIKGDGKAGTTGIQLRAREGVEIKNLEVKNYKKGIYLAHSYKSHLENIELAGNAQRALEIEYSMKDTLENIDAHDNKYGVRVYGSSQLTLKNSQINDNNWGIVLKESSNNQVESNQVNNNGRGFMLIEKSSDNQVSDNEICGSKVIDVDVKQCTGEGNTGSNACETMEDRDVPSLGCEGTC